MGDSTKVEIGVCNVLFGESGSEVDLGYTKGNVKVSYSADSVEVTVDQEDAPLDEIVTKQTFEVVVPLAETSMARLYSLLPGTSVIVDGYTFTGEYDGDTTYSDDEVVVYGGDFFIANSATTTAVDGAPATTGWDALGSDVAVNLSLSGGAGTSLQNMAKQLIIKPVGSEDDANDWITVYYAAPKPSISFSFEKENVRVYEVTFKALVGDNGWVDFGDITATSA